MKAQYASKFSLTPGAILVLAIVIGGAGYWVYKTFPNLFNGGNGVDGADDEIDTDKLTYSDAEYSTMKWQLYNAMSGPGTNENVIFGVFRRLKTRSDYFRVVSEFGTMDDMNLIEWLQDELSEDEQRQLQQIIDSLGVKLFTNANGDII